MTRWLFSALLATCTALMALTSVAKAQDAVPAGDQTKWLVCGTPASLWPTLDRVDANNPFQLLMLDASVLGDGCMYSNLSEYDQKQVGVHWMYYREPLLFEVAKVTVIDDGQPKDFWAVPRTFHMADIHGEVPHFALDGAGEPDGALGKFIRRPWMVFKQPTAWDGPGS